MEGIPLFDDWLMSPPVHHHHQQQQQQQQQQQHSLHQHLHDGLAAVENGFLAPPAIPAMQGKPLSDLPPMMMDLNFPEMGGRFGHSDSDTASTGSCPSPIQSDSSQPDTEDEDLPMASSSSSSPPAAAAAGRARKRKQAETAASPDQVPERAPRRRRTAATRGSAARAAAGNQRKTRAARNSSPAAGALKSPTTAASSSSAAAAASEDSETNLDLQKLLETEEMNRRRLARKAELARLSRRRKKNRLADLEQENKVLRETMEKLQEMNQQLLLQRHQTEFANQISAVMASGGQQTTAGGGVKIEPGAGEGPSVVASSEHPVASSASVPSAEEQTAGEKQSPARPSDVMDCEARKIHAIVQELGELASSLASLEQGAEKESSPLDSAALSLQSVQEIVSSAVKREESEEDEENAAEQEAKEKELRDSLLLKMQEFEAAQKHREGLMKFMCQSLVSGLQQPSLPVRFLQWILRRTPKFYQDPKGLWRSLTREELQLSEAQIQEVLRWRELIHQENPPMDFVSAVHGEEALQEMPRDGLTAHLMTQVMEAMAQEAWLGHQMMQLFTPPQFSRFCAFVSRFGDVCMKIDA